MFEYMENPKLLGSLQGISVTRGEFVDRPSHAFIFKQSGASRYCFRDRTVLLSEGEVLFIPKGETYTVQKVSEGESRYALLNFQGSLPGAVPERYPFADPADFDRLCMRLCRLPPPDTAADRCRAMALFYEILACVSETARPGYCSSDAVKKLEPAVRYLQEHLFDPQLRIGMLHTLCGMSDTYFRRLFCFRFGAAPKKYILHRRLDRARAILENGEYNSVAEVAMLAGFEDPLYFSKAFHARYGCPPSQWK